MHLNFIFEAIPQGPPNGKQRGEEVGIGISASQKPN